MKRTTLVRLFTIAVILTLFCSLSAFAGGTKEDPAAPEASAAPAQQPAPEPVPAPANPRIKLATTTSTENSGLLGYLLPIFQAKTGYTVDVVAVGTGAALKLGENGDADVVLVHARAQEDAFVAAGFGIDRRDVMYNDFIVLGPANDPAKLAAAKSSADAFSRIAAAGSVFVSRGDNSGTHTKEKDIWKAAGITPAGGWYKEAGQGMEQVILMANALQGYTLADRGTWIATKDKTSLVISYQGDKGLFNPYGIIAVNPSRWPSANYEGAAALIKWIMSPEGQKAIEDYKLGGDQLFFVYK